MLSRFVICSASGGQWKGHATAPFTRVTVSTALSALIEYPDSPRLFWHRKWSRLTAHTHTHARACVRGRPPGALGLHQGRTLVIRIVVELSQQDYNLYMFITNIDTHGEHVQCSI